MSRFLAFENLVQSLSTQRESLISKWNQSIEADPKMRTYSHLTRREFRDHIPQVLESFGARLLAFETQSHERTQSHESQETRLASQHATNRVEDAAKKHGAHRWQQGYSLEEMAREWGHLSLVVLDEIERFSTQDSLLEYVDSEWVEARRLWSQTVAEGISASAARFDQLGRHEAESRMRDLEGVLEKVRAFDRERGEILRQASHDLRGSLTVVKGAASLLEPSQLDRLQTEDWAQLVHVLNSGVSALSEMMGDLLDLARLEADQETRVLEQFDVSVLLSGLGRNMELLAQEKGLVLHVEGSTKLIVEGDRNKVSRIAQNLLLNAVKYTEEGHVTLAWHPLELGDAHHWELIVEDTGGGLETTQTPLARELTSTTEESRKIGAFIPSESTVSPITSSPGTSSSGTSYTLSSHQQRSRIVSGEGVGLSIVKRLCEMLDASLELETGPNGSKFRIVFPRSYS